MPAFPFKSPNNRHKTLGPLPDLGEKLALKNLEKICQEISTIYPYGVDLCIVSDGRVFADILGISDSMVNEYHKELAKLIQKHKHLHIKHLENFLGNKEPEELRKQLLEYAPTQEQIIKEVKENNNVRKLYLGLTRFMIDEEIHPELLSSRAIQKKSKKKAKEILKRNRAYDKLIEQNMPAHIRLSIHPHDTANGKFGIELIENAQRWATPWHNVVVMYKQTPWLMKRIDAEKKGAKLIFENNRPSHFIIENVK